MGKFKAFWGWLLCLVWVHDWYSHTRHNEGSRSCWGGTTYDRICVRCEKEERKASKLIAAESKRRALQKERFAKANAALDKIQASKKKCHGDEA